MKRRGTGQLVAVVSLALLGCFLSFPSQSRADDALRLLSIEFPKECPGQCDFILKIEGDLSAAKDLVAEVKYAIERTSGARQNKIDLSTKKHPVTSIDAKNGTATFHVSFRGESHRMATCVLHYVMKGKAMTTNEVKSSWFDMTERGLAPVPGAVQRKSKSNP